MIQVGLFGSVRIGEQGNPLDWAAAAPSIPANARAALFASSDMFASISATSKLEIISPALADFLIDLLSSIFVGVSSVLFLVGQLQQQGHSAGGAAGIREILGTRSNA